MRKEEIITKIQDDINRFLKYHPVTDEEREFISNIFDDVEKLRDKEKCYFVPLPFLVTTDFRQQYLTYKDGTWFASRRNHDLKQTWKGKDLKRIPDEYRQYAVELIEK